MNLDINFTVIDGRLIISIPGYDPARGVYTTSHAINQENTEALRHLLNQQARERANRKLADIDQKVEEHRMALRALDKERMKLDGSSPFLVS